MSSKFPVSSHTTSEKERSRLEVPDCAERFLNERVNHRLLEAGREVG